MPAALSTCEQLPSVAATSTSNKSRRLRMSVDGACGRHADTNGQVQTAGHNWDGSRPLQRCVRLRDSKVGFRSLAWMVQEPGMDGSGAWHGWFRTGVPGGGCIVAAVLIASLTCRAVAELTAQATPQGRPRARGQAEGHTRSGANCKPLKLIMGTGHRTPLGTGISLHCIRFSCHALCQAYGSTSGCPRAAPLPRPLPLLLSSLLAPGLASL